MPLDDLVSVIETLQQRIKDHGDSLRQNETRTRMALIDPLLRALGWDVADPGVVTPEYDVSGQRADYALLNNSGSPATFVEAKKLGESLIPHRMQMVNYANMSGVPYAGLTDGNNWEMYVVFDQKPLDQRRILDLSITNTPAHQCALQLLLLWRPNLAAGQPVAANEPVFKVGSEEEPSNDDESVQLTPPSEEHWTSLAELQSVTNMTPPSTVRLPDGDERSIERWWNVPFEIAEWHIKTGRLKSDSCPIKIGTTRYLVSASPNHSNGTPFNQARQLSQGLFLDTPYDANGLLNGAKFLIEHCGGDLGTVWLKFL